MRLVTADGAVLDVDGDRDPELLAACRVSLGALGVITRVTLQCVPAFRLHAVEEARPLDDVLDGLDELLSGSDHAELYWMPGSDAALVKRNNRTDDPLRPLSALARTRDKLLVENVGFGALCRIGRRWPSTVPRIASLFGSAVPTLDVVDRSDRVFCSRRLVRFAEMEYAVPYEHLRAAVEAVRSIAARSTEPIMFPSRSAARPPTTACSRSPTAAAAGTSPSTSTRACPSSAGSGPSSRPWSSWAGGPLGQGAPPIRRRPPGRLPPVRGLPRRPGPARSAAALRQWLPGRVLGT